MTELSQNQIKWIYDKCCQLCNKWNDRLPGTDEEWKQLHDEWNRLYKQSRNDELMKQLLIATANYIDIQTTAAKDGRKQVANE